MKKVIITIFVCIIWLPLFLCGVFLLFGKKMDVELSGYFNEFSKPEWKWEMFSTGEYQQSFVNWLDNNFIPRGIYIKTYNTIQFYLFDSGNRIIGTNYDIFEPDYITAELCLEDANNYNLPENREELRQYVEQLQHINEKLSQIDKFLYVYITPSKAHFDYKNIPKSYFLQAPEDGVRCIDYFRELMDEASLSYFDSQNIADTLDYPAFYTTGIHWSRTFEQEVSNIVLNEITNINGKAYRNFSIGEAESSFKPYWRDTDVFKLLNIWGGYSEPQFYQYQIEKEDPTQHYDNLRILLQGGSFAQGFRRDVLACYPESIINYVCYCKYFMDNTGAQYSLNNSWETLDLEEYLNQVDGVVIEINEAVLNRYSDGFVNYLDSVLENYTPKSTVPNCIKAVTFTDSEEWNEKALKGFYGLGDESVWVNKYSTVNIEDKLIAESGLDIEFSVPDALFVQNDKVKIDIYINGEKLYDEVFYKEWQGTAHFAPEELPRCEYGEDAYEIYLSSDAAFVPQEMGMSDDTRSLALEIYYIGRAE